VQDLMIEMVVHLLEHKNPYTGKTYAHDPALSYIELQNEDDIFFRRATCQRQHHCRGESLADERRRHAQE